MPQSPNLILSLPPEQQLEIAAITAKMLSLGFAATFTEAEQGPLIRIYRFRPAPASLYARISGRSEELALSLGVEAVRISRAGALVEIAIPRADRELIRFDSCLHSFLSTHVPGRGALPMMLGKSAQGTVLSLDLSLQPHILIAGATGSGKSIFTAQLIASLALARAPEELELLLADTKQLDLVLFRSLPHVSAMLTTVEDIRAQLLVLLEETRKRTALMSGVARNIKEWNTLGLQPLNYKVLVIDEYADVVQTDYELLKGFKPAERPPTISDLTRQLAQISRAAGIHIILATQRPSARIVTGDIKTNFPTRISFKLPSMADSRVVLDENGAESLLAQGDFLYRTAGSTTLERGHSAFVGQKDIALVLEQNEAIRRQYALAA
jgi:DNA segregation ATPase FtsK/SpoIIIE, S-DNA-T family